MQNPFKTLKQTYKMNIKPLTEAYEQALQEKQQQFLKGIAEFFGAKSISFEGGENYNDEEYYDDLMNLKINGESVRGNFKLGAEVYQKLFNKETPFKEDEYGDSAWEQWDEIKEELMNQMPDFIKTKTCSYDSN